MTLFDQSVLLVLLPATLVYTGVALWFLRGLHRRQPTDRLCESNPFVSVVIAARNEESYIGPCLDALSNQTYPQDRFEVLVIDDDSTDATFREASERPFATVLHPDPRFNDHAAKKRPMATGVDQAKGSIILTTDADCTVPPGWVEAMTRSFLPDVDVVIGFSQINDRSRPGSVWEQLQALDFLALMAAAAGAADNGIPLAATGQNLAFRKSAYDRVGGYHDIRHRPSGDDVLLLQLLTRRGGTRAAFCSASESFVSTWRTESPRGYLRQRRRWASNASMQVLNPPFFAYIASVFAANLAILLAILTGGIVALAGLAAGLLKLLGDLLVIRKGATRFGRRDLLRVFPLWALLQPPYIVLAGVLGTTLGFTWKNRQHTHRSPTTDLNHATV